VVLEESIPRTIKVLQGIFQLYIIKKILSTPIVNIRHLSGHWKDPVPVD
jgi:hypothetical protein